MHSWSDTSSHEPPDGGGTPHVQGKERSFKEKLMGISRASSSCNEVDLIRGKLAHFDYVEGNRLYPIFHLDDSVRD